MISNNMAVGLNVKCFSTHDIRSGGGTFEAKKK